MLAGTGQSGMLHLSDSLLVERRVGWYKVLSSSFGMGGFCLGLCNVKGPGDRQVALGLLSDHANRLNKVHGIRWYKMLCWSVELSRDMGIVDDHTNSKYNDPQVVNDSTASTDTHQQLPTHSSPQERMETTTDWRESNLKILFKVQGSAPRCVYTPSADFRYWTTLLGEGLRLFVPTNHGTTVSAMVVKRLWLS